MTHLSNTVFLAETLERVLSLLLELQIHVQKGSWNVQRHPCLGNIHPASCTNMFLQSWFLLLLWHIQWGCYLYGLTYFVSILLQDLFLLPRHNNFILQRGNMDRLVAYAVCFQRRATMQTYGLYLFIANKCYKAMAWALADLITI